MHRVQAKQDVTIVTVQIAVDTEDYEDAISFLLTENENVLDWRYVKESPPYSVTTRDGEIEEGEVFTLPPEDKEDVTISLEEVERLIALADGNCGTATGIYLIQEAIFRDSQRLSREYCPTCKKAVRFVPVIHQGVYRAFVVCDSCQKATQF